MTPTDGETRHKMSRSEAMHNTNSKLLNISDKRSAYEAAFLNEPIV